MCKTCMTRVTVVSCHRCQSDGYTFTHLHFKTRSRLIRNYSWAALSRWSSTRRWVGRLRWGVHVCHRHYRISKSTAAVTVLPYSTPTYEAIPFSENHQKTNETHFPPFPPHRPHPNSHTIFSSNRQKAILSQDRGTFILNFFVWKDPLTQP